MVSGGRRAWTQAELRERLGASKSAQRRSAAKTIGRERLTELADALHEAYLAEREDSRTWETQYEMLVALGLVGHMAALPDIEPIVRANEPHDMITYGAAQAYVRLSRDSLADAAPSLELLEFGRLSVVDGCLVPIGRDRMMPDTPSIRALTEGAWDLHRHPDRVGKEAGLMDPRDSLAAACALWDSDLVRPFLEHCMATGDQPLRRVAEASLEGRYIWRR